VGQVWRAARQNLTVKSVVLTLGLAEALGMLISEYFRRRAILFALILALFGLGGVAGGVAAGALDEDVRGELARFLGAYLVHLGAPAAQEGGAVPSVAGEVLRGAGLPWLLGLSVIGAPIVLGLVFLRGVALGFTLLFLYRELSWRGLLLGLSGIVPHALFAVPGALLAAGASCAFSLGAIRLLLGRRPEANVYAQLATATILSLAAAALIAVGAWIQGNISPVLIRIVAPYLL